MEKRGESAERDYMNYKPEMTNQEFENYLQDAICTCDMMHGYYCGHNEILNLIRERMEFKSDFRLIVFPEQIERAAEIMNIPETENPPIYNCICKNTTGHSVECRYHNESLKNLTNAAK